MGPAATADMFQKFIQLTPASCDQNHIPLLISSIPDIPDRSACILNHQQDPEQHLLTYLHNLEKAGATCIVIACNTAHFWFDRLQAKSNVKMLSMIDSTVNCAVKMGVKKIGLLATNATVATKLYQNALEKQGIDVVLPTTEGQNQVMESIYLYKAGKIEQSVSLMEIEQQALLEQGAECIILGCTEVPLILSEAMKKQPHFYIDSTLELVKTAIDWYYQQ